MTPPENGFEPRIGRSVSLDHAAELLGVSRRTIYNRIREGRLQTIRTIGGSQRVLIDSMSETREHEVDLARAENPGTTAARRSSL
jgi:excisionase family DNA binding protein